MKLYYNTVTPLLQATLNQLMAASEFSSFRLVGGTSLSLQLGHRESVDIDLFSDSAYGSIDFGAIEKYLCSNFLYVDTPLGGNMVGMGQSYYIGEDSFHSIKLDLYYTDSFIRPLVEQNNIRMAHINDIVAMKIDVVGRGGRKKDFWDIHELMQTYTLQQMLLLHKERYPYSHNHHEIVENFIHFDTADSDFDPKCLKGKYWEVIKLDLLAAVEKLPIE